MGEKFPRILPKVATSTSLLDTVITKTKSFNYYVYVATYNQYSFMFIDVLPEYGYVIRRWFIPVVCNQKYHKLHKVYKSNTTKFTLEHKVK